MGLQFATDVDGSRIEVYRNPLLWTLRILVDGQVMVKDYPWWPFKRIRRYPFAVGRHNVVIEHVQLSYPPGGWLRLQTYLVYVDGKLVSEQHSF